MKNKMMLAICLSLATATTSLAREAQPNDKRNGEGKGHPIVARQGQPEPGDVKGEGKGHPVARRGQPEPGDDRGAKGEGKGHPVA
jgi:hypothetical protein